jgi:glycosyltransferase involved in cell wall biosynthesis
METKKSNDALPTGLSIIVPVYNEKLYVRGVIHQLKNINVNFDYEIIVVNDGSTDGSTEILKSIDVDKHYYLLHYPINNGKGSAVRKGIEQANFSHILIFDSDNEYFASDIEKLFEPISKGHADIVFGVRTPGAGTVSHSVIHSLGRIIMTKYANIMFGTKIQDLHTGLKLISTKLLRSLSLEENSFGLDTEITCLLLKSEMVPFEIPIRYVGRTISDGKKIRFKDALICFKIITQVKFFGSTLPRTPEFDLYRRKRLALKVM